MVYCSELHVIFCSDWTQQPAARKLVLWLKSGANGKAAAGQKACCALDLYFTSRIAEFDPSELQQGFMGPCGTELVNRRWDYKFLLCETVKWVLETQKPESRLGGKTAGVCDVPQNWREDVSQNISALKPLPASHPLRFTQVVTDQPSLSILTRYLSEIHFPKYLIGMDRQSWRMFINHHLPISEKIFAHLCVCLYILPKCFVEWRSLSVWVSYSGMMVWGLILCTEAIALGSCGEERVESKGKAFDLLV